ncbi:Leucine-rich repeat receptor-like serine/threonine-protein kinase BAM1 [Platanthera guangdongensis]|uniref:Leucine-rich repeat receptor-like serine/threonine-protein kinase BAM1 n=1 Tax=Platanthera guangdongensis TaxID=2320717 RepID=A0ABR2N543_9ASPA
MSPFFCFIFFLLPIFFSFFSCTNCNPLLEDAAALSLFQNNLRLPPPEWNISIPGSVCSWAGVGCDRGRVSSIDLSGLNISGTVEIGGLPALVSLSLAGNALGGVIAISQLPSLRYLNISGNQFSGGLDWNYSGELPSLEIFDAYDNNFTAPLPLGVADLKNLRYLDLGGNFFYGEIPPSYGGMLAMESLSLAGNDLRGRIPGELGNLAGLNHLYLGYFNAFDGGIPAELGELVNLVHLDISGCGIDGAIPNNLGKLINLRTLFLHTNALSGTIPAAIGNLTKLVNLDLSNNALTGEIPNELAGLTNLNLFNLFMNRLHGSIPEFVAGLPELETLELFTNNFTGTIPENLGNNGKLRLLDLSSNKLTGIIPKDLCPSNKLKILHPVQEFSVRAAAGEFGEVFELDEENFESKQGESQLNVLNLSNNLLSGAIPASISNLSFLETLILSGNRFSGKIPGSIGILRHAEKLDLSRNELIGSIPLQIGQCGRLTYLDLSGNNISGSIPSELAGLGVLSYLNLSRNNLSNSIPRSIGSIASLTVADFSFNNLSGFLPDSGQLAFLNASAFAGNPLLCGTPISKSCVTSKAAPPPPPLHRLPPDFKLVFALGLLICSLVFAAAAAANKRSTASGGPWKMTAFQKVSFGMKEVIESMKDGNEIGRGGAGVVYLGRCPNGDGIAVKRLMGFGTGGNDHGFRAEIRTLGSIRHRNIVRLLAFCSDSRTNVLVYEFMGAGSLGEALHGGGGGFFLGWDRRYRIALEAARGLSYLHHDCSPMIIHRDVKPNNILLDVNLEAHVADFGLARYIQDAAASDCMSAVAGSYGYIAPEYAYTLRVDEKSDVYSFGVVLLELITGRRPVGEFGDGVDIAQWVKKTTNGEKQRVGAVMDSRLLGAVPMDEAAHVFFVSMLCIQENSVRRPAMRDVVQMLSEFARHVSQDEGSTSSSSSASEQRPPEKKQSSQQTNCYSKLGVHGYN